MTTPAGTGDFTYDDSGQLTAADYNFQTDESFSCDLTGNRTMTGYSTGDNNQLLSDGTHNYTYDKEGNRSKKTTISTGDYIDYEWDHRNRMTRVTFRDSMNTKTKEVLYTYDVFDRRIEKQLDSNGNGTIDATEVFIYDAGAKDGLEDILFIFDASSNLLHRYLHGPGIDQPLADESSSSLYWLLPGHLGTICDVVDYTSGTDTTSVVNQLTYTSFGEIASETDASKTPLYAFTGREWDEDMFLYYYRARWYCPSEGLFTTTDRLPDSEVKSYNYADNSPTIYIDPDGFAACRLHDALRLGDITEYSRRFSISCYFRCVCPPGSSKQLVTVRLIQEGLPERIRNKTGKQINRYMKSRCQTLIATANSAANMSCTDFGDDDDDPKPRPQGPGPKHVPSPSPTSPMPAPSSPRSQPTSPTTTVAKEARRVLRKATCPKTTISWTIFVVPDVLIDIWFPHRPGGPRSF